MNYIKMQNCMRYFKELFSLYKSNLIFLLTLLCDLSNRMLIASIAADTKTAGKGKGKGKDKGKPTQAEPEVELY